MAGLECKWGRTVVYEPPFSSQPDRNTRAVLRIKRLFLGLPPRRLSKNQFEPGFFIISRPL
jgi:hypothetical protein